MSAHEKSYPPDGAIIAARRFTYVNTSGGTFTSDDRHAAEKFPGTARLRVERQWEDWETGQHFACAPAEEPLRAFLARNAHPQNKTVYVSEFDLITPASLAGQAAHALAARVGELLLAGPDGGTVATLPAMLGDFLRKRLDDFMAEQMDGVEDEGERDAVRGLVTLLADELDPEGAAAREGAGA